MVTKIWIHIFPDRIDQNLENCARDFSEVLMTSSDQTDHHPMLASCYVERRQKDNFLDHRLASKTMEM